MMRSHTPFPSSQPAGAVLLALALLAVAWGIVGAGSANADKRSVTVMTQNLYQGTEFAHIRALVGGPPPSQAEVLKATTEDYATYQATRFKDRAKQIAGEIAQNSPALVGLQEVATWHKGAFDPAHPFALPPAVSEDFTQVLIEALKADGMEYQAVSATARPEGNFTLAFPVISGAPPFGLTAVGMVERGVILARSDLPPGQLKLSNPQSGTYSCEFCKVTLENPVTKETIPFTDSWESIDVKLRGKTFRFITTHLDALEPSGVVRFLQAKELLEGPANTTLPMVLTGDLNGGPKTPPSGTGPAAYDELIGGGLSDTWVAAGLGAPPLTCCHLPFEDLVNDPNAEFGAGQELDHVLTRGAFTVLDEHLVGDKVPTPKPEPFIWPSDHAGMVSTLELGP
ncbi:MAG TPA: endonuclease/exonuclease/phosphatase family protein [Solirubrobacteraceae bacterium]|jgi:endonuclease/exonuclease/phosphatase family metal-dependent hydrolase|nr:endonuclease/exonuclease/phosphatase family protein [Solirubrobacteraceae bacterium]